jgi:hypothetical protein
MEQRGKFISFLCIALIVAVVVSIFYFVASKGLATFFKDKINVFDFLFAPSWLFSILLIIFSVHLPRIFPPQTIQLLQIKIVYLFYINLFLITCKFYVKFVNFGF